MKPFILTVLSFSVLLLSGCITFTKGGEQAKFEQADDLPIICKAGPDCDKKWMRAGEWVTLHSVVDIPVQTDMLIETEQPHGLDDRAGFIVRKVHDNDDIYAIEFSITCGNWFGCHPQRAQSRADFSTYLTSSAENPKVKLGLRVHPISGAEAQADGIQGTQGVVTIVQVTRSSIAEKAGMLAGDIIINYDGHSITTQDELDLWASRTVHGQTAIILILRNKETHPVKIRF